MEATKEVPEVMPKAVTEPGREKPVVLADGGNIPSASLTPRVLRRGQGHGIPEGARVNVCPYGTSWFAVGADDVRWDIRRSASSMYLCSLPTYISRIDQ